MLLLPPASASYCSLENFQIYTGITQRIKTSFEEFQLLASLCSQHNCCNGSEEERFYETKADAINNHIISEKENLS